MLMMVASGSSRAIAAINSAWPLDMQRGGGFVQGDDVRPVQQAPRDREPLFLALGQYPIPARDLVKLRQEPAETGSRERSGGTNVVRSDEMFERILHRLLRFRVQRRSRLVQDQNRRVLEQRTRNGDASRSSTTGTDVRRTTAGSGSAQDMAPSATSRRPDRMRGY